MATDLPELRGAEERFLIADRVAERNAAEVKADAARIVREHAVRLGLDAFAAMVIVRAIEAL